MTNLTPKTTEVLVALRAHVEGCKVELNGKPARDVYLDNARPNGMSVRAFAGHLSALQAAGLYKPLDGYAFGTVVIETLNPGSGLYTSGRLASAFRSGPKR